MLLYDLTSTYFEGSCQQIPKARHGYSRDGRPDCRQVVIALVVTADGLPLAYEVLAGNTLLRPLVNSLNRQPISPGVTEAQYQVHVVCRPDAVSDVRDLLDAELSRANYPVREVETLSDNDEQVELAAILVPTTAKDAELDAVVEALERSPLVRSATWTVESVA